MPPQARRSPAPIEDRGFLPGRAGAGVVNPKKRLVIISQYPPASDPPPPVRGDYFPKPASLNHLNRTKRLNRSPAPPLALPPPPPIHDRAAARSPLAQIDVEAW